MVFHKLIVFRSNILKLEAAYLNAAELLQICEQLRCSNFALRFFALSMHSPNLVTLPNFNLRKREELLVEKKNIALKWEGKREQAWKLKKKRAVEVASTISLAQVSLWNFHYKKLLAFCVWSFPIQGHIFDQCWNFFSLSFCGSHGTRRGAFAGKQTSSSFSFVDVFSAGSFQPFFEAVLPGVFPVLPKCLLLLIAAQAKSEINNY